MTMSKGDFQAIAAAVGMAKDYTDDEENSPDNESRQWALMVVTQELAKACEARHGGIYAFDRDVFVASCGFPDA